MFVRKYETRRARRLSRRRSASRVSASVLVREDAGRYARSSMSTSHHAVDALGGGSNADASFVFFFFPGRSRAFFRDVVAEIRSTRRRGARTAALLARLARRRATQRPAPGLERRLERGEVELEIRELRLERRARRKRRRRARVFFFGSSRVRLRVLPGGERRKRVPGDIQPRRGRRVRVHPRVLPACRRRGEERRRRRAPRVRLRPSFFSFSPEQGRARRRRSRRRRCQRDDVRRGERDTRVRRGRVCLRVPLALALVRSFRERLVEQPRRVSGGRLVAVRLRFLFVVARTVSRRFRRRRDGSRPSRRGDRE